MAAEYYALNRYKYMWIYVMFDLPTKTKQQRKNASLFRKMLVQDGFSMLQYSVYIRHCASFANSDVHIKRVKDAVPAEGIVSVLRITDRQFGDTCTFVGKKATAPPSTPEQLELF